MFQKIVMAALRASKRGLLEVCLPGGEVLRFGGLGKSPRARMDIHHENFFRRSVVSGPIGFAESYLEGEWTTSDLPAVLAFFVVNAEDSPAFDRPGRPRNPFFGLLSVADRIRHLARPNSRSLSRKNIGDHYDLSNDFFKLWLDPGLTYSSAFFESPESSLGDAQNAKYDRLCRKLAVGPNHHILEIGTGWGGFSLRAASEFGCRITTTTISAEQHAEATDRIARAGLEDRITVLLEDYRDLCGRFDRVVSIEMIEAVGDAYVDSYFQQISRLLVPDGLVGIQAILCPDQRYDILRAGVDFIQKHIFPGSLLMSNARILRATSRTDGLNLHHFEDMGAHYARTLNLWAGAFELQLDAVRDLGFDETFIRKWRYYLAYCEAAFAMRFITVAQLVFTNPGNLGLNPASPIAHFQYAKPLR
jgi:cyclopropane-fatty-acyl-phospholipid synthase